MILSIAYFLIMEESNPLFRFGRWERLHRHPYGGDIASQRSSELFASITEEQKQAFFRLQGRRRVRDEYWAYDSTSISSYSECLSQVRHGKNKDDDRLPQINLLLIFGQKSNLPFYYRKLAGNIPDVKTVVYFTLKVYRYFNVKVYHFNIKSKLVLSFLEVPPKRIKRALLFSLKFSFFTHHLSSLFQSVRFPIHIYQISLVG